MTPQMGLTGSAILFVAFHFLLSHPLRRPLVRAVGEGPFRGIYSLIALVTFAGMVYFYNRIGREPRIIPEPGDALWAVASVLMWVASILLVGSFFKNPALVGAAGPKGGPAGVLRITRHPMMWSFALWAAVHFVIIGTAKSMVFDLAIVVLALAGAAGQDAKKARHMGEDWHDWTAQTAFVPFTRGIGNPGAVALIGGTILFFAATWLHPYHVGFWRWIA
jgi:uncharacterized membrane protein